MSKNRRSPTKPWSLGGRFSVCQSCTNVVVQAGGDKEKKKKESILDLTKYLEKAIRVKFQGGREGTGNILSPPLPIPNSPCVVTATGILKGFDPLINLVLDNTTEYLRVRAVVERDDCWCTDPDDPFKLTEDTRYLGLVVCRGTTVVVICPVDSMEAIANPFSAPD
ncbi:LSM7 [Cordylochernes scorpioides]|uniref:LSM7 n=1 Tax=Cordylochernes scorpioides TaxID=51811 RepID=A0ABY6JZI8_9ARAC|nr:LSM7 [Cordylochernes scorpioides]